MRYFVTGSTGFIGTAVVKELLSAGHTVVGLTRSDTGAEQLKALGAVPLRGTLDDTALLKNAASQSDATLHLGFEHDMVNFAASCAKDRAAITALGDGLVAAGGPRALVTTSGTMLLEHGRFCTENDTPSTDNAIARGRGPSETICLSYAQKGVRASVVRLPPITHGPGSSGFAGYLSAIAVQKGVSAYIGTGANRWCACHRDDAAKLYLLAAEKASPGSVFHAVAQEGVSMKDIAAGIGKAVGVPAASLEGDAAAAHFGFLTDAVAAENVVSSKMTRDTLGWAPTSLSLLEDIPVIVKYAKTYMTK